jgi:predicted transcriptional regulator
MLNKNALKAEMVRNGITQKQLAKTVGISEKTFITKMKKGVFGTDEAQIIIDTLSITNPADIFFAKEVN